VRQRIIRLAILEEQQGDFRVGGEIVRIHLQLFVELHGRLLQLAGGFQCLPVERMHPRHLRIEFHGARQVPCRCRQVVTQQLALPQQEGRFRRLAVAQDAIQQELRLPRTIVFHQRHAEHVDDGVVVGILLAQRRKHFHRLRRLVCFQHAIGQQQGRFQLQWLQFVERLQMFDGLRQPPQLVVRQRQVHPDARIVRQLLECDVVLRDGSGELPVLHQGGAKIRTDLGRVGIALQELAVKPDGGGHIAGLKRRFGFPQRVRGPAGPKRGESQWKQQNHRGESHSDEIITCGGLPAMPRLITGNRLGIRCKTHP